MSVQTLNNDADIFFKVISPPEIWLKFWPPAMIKQLDIKYFGIHHNLSIKYQALSIEAYLQKN